MFELIGLLVVYAAAGYGVLKWKKVDLSTLTVPKEILDILTWPKFLIHSEKVVPAPAPVAVTVVAVPVANVAAPVAAKA